MIKRIYQLISLLNTHTTLRLLICFLPGLLVIKLSVMTNANATWRIIAFSLFGLGILCFAKWNKFKDYYISLKTKAPLENKNQVITSEMSHSRLSLSQCLDDMLFLTQDEKQIIYAIKRADILIGHGSYEDAIIKAHHDLCEQCQNNHKTQSDTIN